MPIRVMIVDDSAFMRRALSAIVESDGRFELVGTAYNGINALEKVAKLKPDVVTMDIEMPELDGIGALKQLMASCDNPPAVLMCSSLTKAGSRVALDALEFGAADVIAKPTTAIGLHESPDAKLLLSKIQGVALHKGRFQARIAERETERRELPPNRPMPSRRLTSLPKRPFQCVLIGSSTGGPPALDTLLRQIPPGISTPIVVAQHMPPTFTQCLAERLDTLTALTVVHAEQGMRLLPGTVYIGQGGKHISLGRVPGGHARIEISQQPEEELYKPSVNVLFQSAAELFGGKCLGVMLTGMGEDGLAGSRAIIEKGGVLLGQDEASCVVYGMPKAVKNAGLVSAQFPPAELGVAIAHMTDCDVGHLPETRGTGGFAA